MIGALTIALICLSPVIIGAAIYGIGTFLTNSVYRHLPTEDE